MARRALVVEDERLPRRELCALLEERGVEVVAEADSVATARAAIRRERPDLVFLDIQLGRETAFDLLEAETGTFDVVFVTAYDRYAVRAFEVNAVDYLLKPVDPDRLSEALDRLDRPPTETTPDDPPGVTLEDRLFLRAGKRWKFVRVADIVAIEADGDYTRVRLRGADDLMLGRSLRTWETLLPSRPFARIHRSTLVNLNYVIRVDEWFNRTFRVHVQGIDEPYAMSRRYARRMRG